MFGKRDVAVIGAAILLVASFFIVALAKNRAESPALVKITVGDEEPQIYPLEENTVIIDRKGCINVIEITEDGVRMVSSNCTNHDCVEQGEVTAENISSRALGRFIICLPHRVTVELAEAE